MSATFVFVCVYIALKGHSFYNIAIFDLQVILLLQCVSTLIAQWFGWKSKTGFQDGGYSCHFGFPIGMILAIFHLHVNLFLHCKFQLNSPWSSREDVQNRLSIWRLWQPSWISERYGFSNFNPEIVRLVAILDFALIRF